jgi:aspartate/tyrosine/aromatic aminotransferase
MISGTLSIRFAFDFLKTLNSNITVYFPNETWLNHFNIAKFS